jgi:hypothetical protein
MDQIFNELSASGCYDSRHSAIAGIQRLIKLSQQLSSIGFSGNLRTVPNFRQLLLAPDYTIQQWTTDRDVVVDRELQRWLLTFTTKPPFITQLIDQMEENRAFEFRIDEHLCAGLGLAYLWKSGALSLDGDNRFTSTPISLQLYQIDPTGESVSTVSVESIYSFDQLQSWRERFDQARLESISSGDEIICNCKQYFPYLSICDSATKQIAALTGKEKYFQEIIRHFHELNKTMQMWTKGYFNPTEINWSPESEPTLQKYGEQRTFMCYDGQCRLFSSHSKLKDVNMRIHFFPLTTERVVFIGYVGKHLPTVKAPT